MSRLLRLTLMSKPFSFILLMSLVAIGTAWIQLQECNAEQYRVLQYTLQSASPQYRHSLDEIVQSDTVRRWDYAMLMKSYWKSSAVRPVPQPPELDNVEQERLSFFESRNATGQPTALSAR